MATFSANFLSKFSTGIRYRAPVIHWARTSTGMACSCSCSEGRDYSTTFPVRYIPNKSSKPEESVVSLPEMRLEFMGKHETAEKIVERPELYRGGNGSGADFLLDNEEPDSPINLGCDLVEKEIDGDMWAEGECMNEPEEPGQELEVEYNLGRQSNRSGKFPAFGNKEDAEKLVIQWLASRAFTAVELRKKLRGKRFPLNIVDAVITDFENRGFINDCLYAETFSRSRWSSLCWGPKRIKQALFQKGISKEDAERALNMVFKDGDNGEGHEAGVGMSKPSMDHLLNQASKQLLRSQGLPREKRNSRIVRWLQYRGFNWGVINFVLKKLESSYPP